MNCDNHGVFFPFGRKSKENSLRKCVIGQGLLELTPVEIVGYEVDEAGSPLTLDNG